MCRTWSAPIPRPNLHLAKLRYLIKRMCVDFINFDWNNFDLHFHILFASQLIIPPKCPFVAKITLK